MKQMKEILEKVYINESLRKRIVPLFIGNPGVGKTAIIEEFAKEKNVKLVELITSQMSPFEISGICIPSHETQKMMYYNFDRLDDLKDGDILFFDELLNGNPTVLNACLTILEQRTMISGKKLPNIMIVAAANPQGMTPLTPQIKERFVWYDVKFDSNSWQKFIGKKYGMPTNISKLLVNLIQNESFTSGHNFNTPRSIDKAIEMIIYDVPTPYESTILPILKTHITNTLKEDVDLGNGKILSPNEMVSYLDLIRVLKNVKISNWIHKKERKVLEVIPEHWYVVVNVRSSDHYNCVQFFRQKGFEDYLLKSYVADLLEQGYDCFENVIFFGKNKRLCGYIPQLPSYESFYKGFEEIKLQKLINYLK